MSTPEVSVVMSVFDGEEHLSEALDSVLTQEGVDLEVVVVDDGSTDGSADVLARYAAADPRVRVVRQENQGLTRALVRGCTEARGRWIARQDADDRSLPGRLARQVELIRSDTRLSFVSCWGRTIGPAGEAVHETRRPPEPEAATRALLDDWLGPSAHGTVLMDRAAYERVGGYRDVFHFAQDGDLWLRLAGAGMLAYVPEVLYEDRLRPASITSLRRAAQEEFGLLARACQDARREGRSEEPLLRRAAELRDAVLAGSGPDDARRSLGDFFYFVGANLSQRDPVEARAYLRRAVRLRPLHVRSWVRLGMTWLPR